MTCRALTAGAPAIRTARSSRQVESRPPENITTTGPLRREQALLADGGLDHSSSSSRWRATKISVDSLNPLSRTSAIRSNSRLATGVLDHRPGDEHLPAGGPRRDPGGDVDVAPVVVAVAVQRVAVVDPDPRQRALGLQPLEADRPVGQRRRVRADDHHLVADRLDHPGLVGQRDLDRLDEPLDRVDGLQLALLLGQPRVAGEVGERDRDPHPAEIDRLAVEIGLHVADHVLLDEVLQVALMDLVHHRRGQRQQLAGTAPASRSAISIPIAPERISGSCT